MKFVKYPVATEKAVRLIESDNAVTFVTDKKANKKKIKEEIEKEFNVKVNAVRTFIDTKGRKKAVIILSKETPAIDIATQLGII